jgi:hypothetical protein
MESLKEELPKELFFSKQNYLTELESYQKAEKTLNYFLQEILGKKVIRRQLSKNKAEEKIKGLSLENTNIQAFFGKSHNGKEDQLKEMVKEVVFDLLSEVQTLGGLPVIKKKALEIIDLPEEIIDETTDYILNNPINHTTKLYKIDFDKISINNGKVSLPKDFDDYLRKKHTIYAENEKQLDLYNRVVKLRDEFEYLWKNGLLENFDLRTVPFLTILEGEKDIEIGINYEYIKNA